MVTYNTFPFEGRLQRNVFVKFLRFGYAVLRYQLRQSLMKFTEGNARKSPWAHSVHAHNKCASAVHSSFCLLLSVFYLFQKKHSKLKKVMGIEFTQWLLKLVWKLSNIFKQVRKTTATCNIILMSPLQFYVVSSADNTNLLNFQTIETFLFWSRNRKLETTIFALKFYINDKKAV